ncbi:hypothetical protein [Acinetobacter sp. Ac_5812]|uniref:hypothetical protein n=1 Tax=Acinetobacter sp. Ac_5812 TaxID=1848937 RepID=UPI00148FC7C8|nr:hypothetical protein [Acinetobacter sp. Ac_5812]
MVMKITIFFCISATGQIFAGILPITLRLFEKLDSFRTNKKKIQDELQWKRTDIIAQMLV